MIVDDRGAGTRLQHTLDDAGDEGARCNRMAVNLAYGT
jgi:hypothetical protein